MLANDQAFGWLHDLPLDDKTGLPTIHHLTIVRELGCLRPHTVDMPKVLLKVLNQTLLLLALMFHDILEGVIVLDFAQLFLPTGYRVIFIVQLSSVF